MFKLLAVILMTTTLGYGLENPWGDESEEEFGITREKCEVEEGEEASDFWPPDAIPHPHPPHQPAESGGWV